MNHFGGGILPAAAAALWLNHAVVSWSIAGVPPPADRVSGMQPYFEELASAKSGPAAPNPSPRLEGETELDRVARTGELRVGFSPDNPPFCYRNRDGILVGLEIDLMHRLAVELETQLRLVPYAPGVLGGGS